MRGRRAYAFEIAMRGRDGRWIVVVAKSGMFTRSPKATARSIAERWIFEQAGQLRGGRLVIRGKRRTVPRAFDASVRIRIMDELGARQLAAAYIGLDRSQGLAASAGDRKDHYVIPALALAGGDRD
ncbi:hypothetical protein [Kribbella swartbergensis]